MFYSEKKYSIILLSALAILQFGCKKKENEDKVLKKENTITVNVSSLGDTIQAPDGVQVIFPKNAILSDVSVTVGYTGNENLIIENVNVEIIGKPFTLKMQIDTLQKDIQIRIPKPSGYVQNRTAIIASINPKIPLRFIEEGLYLVATFDNLPLEVAKSILNNSKATREIVIGIITDTHLPIDAELGLKQVTIDNTGKMIFSTIGTISSSDKVLIMVHGWTSSPSSCWTEFLTKIQPQISQSGYTKFITFGYYSGSPINNNGAVFANQIQSQLNGATIDIVAHSMGGLISRCAIENHKMASSIRNLITLGTPHKGSTKANLRQLVGRLIKTKNAYFNQSIDMGTQGMSDLQPNSAIIQDLIDNPQPTTNYYPIAGKSNLGGVIIDDDGVVSLESALGIQNNSNGNIGQVISFNVPLPLNAYSIYQAVNIPHIRLTDEDIVIAFVAAKLNSFNPEVPTNGLVAYYPFNGDANDFSSFNNNGSITGGTSFTRNRKGAPNSALNFDGISGLVQIPSSLSLESPSEGISITAWVKSDKSSSNGAYFLCKSNTGSLEPFQYRAGFSKSDMYIGFKNSNSTQLDFSSSSYLLPENTWKFATYVYDGNQIRFYIDGILISQQSASGKIFPDNKPLEIGRDAHGPIEWFSGTLDDIRIYNRALGTSEIEALYNE